MSLNQQQTHLHLGDSCRTEQPQPGARLNPYPSVHPTAHQSHCLYPVQYHTQSQPQVSQQQSYKAAGSSTIQNIPLNDSHIFGYLLESLNQLSAQQTHINETLAKSDKCLENLVYSISSVRATADGLTKKLEFHDGVLEKLERSSRGGDKTIVDVMKVLVAEIKGFKKTLGKSCDGDDGRTVLGRLDAVTFAVGELLERARDPEANLSKPGTVIDLTSPSPLPRRISQVQSHTYVDVDTSDHSTPMESTPTLVEDAVTNLDKDFTREKFDLVPMDVDPTRTQNILATTSTAPCIETTLHVGSTSQTPRNISGDRPADTRLSNVTLGSIPGIPILKQPYASASTSTATASPVPAIQTEAQCPVDKDKTIAAIRASVAQFKAHYPGIAVSSVGEGKQQQGLAERLESSLLPRDAEMPSLDNMNWERMTAGIDGRCRSGEKVRAKEKGQDKEEIKRMVFDLNGTRNGDVPVPSPGLMDLNQYLRGRPRSSSRFGISLSPSTSLSLSSRAGSRLSVNPSENVSVSSKLPSNAKLYIPTKTKVLVGPSPSHSPRPVVRASPALPTTLAASAGSPAVVGVAISNMPVTVTTPIEKAASGVSSQPTVANTGLAGAAPIRAVTPATIIASPAISPTKKIIPAAPESSHIKLALASPAALSNKPPSQTSALSVATSSITTSPGPTERPTSAASFRLDLFASPATTSNKPPPFSQTSSSATMDEASVSRMVSENENDEGEDEDENSAEKIIGKVELKTVSHNFEKGEGEQGDRFPSSSPPSLSLSPPPSPPIPDSPHFPLVEVSVPPQPSVPSTPRSLSALSFILLPDSPLASVDAVTPKNQTRSKAHDINYFSLSPLSYLTDTSESRSRSQSQSQSKTRSMSLTPPAHYTCVRTPSAARPDSPSRPPIPFAMDVSSSCSPATMNDLPDQRLSQLPIDIQDEDMEKLAEGNNEDEEIDKFDQTAHGEHEHQSPLFGSHSSTNNTSVERHEVEAEEEEQSEKGVAALKAIPNPSPSIEMLLPRELSPISDVKEKGNGKETDKMQVSDTFLKKQYNSLGDDADIVRASVKKTSLLNLKVGKKGESAAVTRVKKRKARSNFIDDEEGESKGEYNDGLDQEKPLKRARQRVSERQMKVEPSEKGNRDSSSSDSGAGVKPRSSTSAPAKAKKEPSSSKGRLSSRGLGKVEWPKITKGEDLVECNKCKSWYHYGCVGITAGDTRLQAGKKYFCPPCKAGTTIEKPNVYTDCWRPGCTVPPGFVVEKIIGRFKKYVGGQGIRFIYLLRWKGYSLSESSWEPEESMYDPPFMIEKFRLDALEEGIDIDKDKTGKILLKVARDPCIPKPT